MRFDVFYRRSKLERIYFGQAAAESLKRELDLTGAKRVLLVVNRSLLHGRDLLDQVITSIVDRLVGTPVAIGAHTPGSDIMEVVDAARRNAVDLLVAVGGGSVIDGAKIATVCLSEGIATLEQLKARRNEASDHSIWPKDLDLEAVRFVGVPVTLAAAEFSWGAGFVDENGSKRSLRHALMAPRAVILDPRATMGTPRDLFLSSGVRAIDHAAERLASLHASSFSDAITREALSLLARSLPRIASAPCDIDARSDAQMATWLSVAGEEAGAGAGASHVIGRVLSLHAAIPHGFTSCILLPAVMKWNAVANAERQQRVAGALGNPELAAGDAIGALIAELGLARRLRDFGVTRESLIEIAEIVCASPAIQHNPRPIEGPSDVLEILELAW